MVRDTESMIAAVNSAASWHHLAKHHDVGVSITFALPMKRLQQLEKIHPLKQADSNCLQNREHFVSVMYISVLSAFQCF